MSARTRRKRRRADRRHETRTGEVDPRSFPETSLSPNTFEGRIQVFGNILRAARYGTGRRGRMARFIVCTWAVLVLLILIASVVART
jgi:hypothetical protein